MRVSEGSDVSLLSSRISSRTLGPSANASSGTATSPPPLRSSVRTDFSLSLRSTTSAWHPSPSASVRTAVKSSPSNAARADAGTDAPPALAARTSTRTALGLHSSTTSSARTGGFNAPCPSADVDGGSFGVFLGSAGAAASKSSPPPRRNDVSPPAPKTSLSRLPLDVL